MKIINENNLGDFSKFDNCNDSGKLTNYYDINLNEEKIKTIDKNSILIEILDEDGEEKLLNENNKKTIENNELDQSNNLNNIFH